MRYHTRDKNGNLIRRIFVSSIDTEFPDGSSWATAYSDIQKAIDECYNLGGGEVWCKSGRYFVSQPISLKNGVRLIGGFCGSEIQIDKQSGYTEISGQNKVRVFYNENIDDTASISSLTICDGNDEYASGMLNCNSSFAIEHCIFLGNNSSDNGAVVAFENSFCMMNACRFNNNDSASIKIDNSALSIYSCFFTENASHAIRANSSILEVVSSVFYKHSFSSGGGIISLFGSRFLSVNCDIFENNSFGIYLSETQATLVNSIIGGNKHNGSDVSIVFDESDGARKNILKVKSTILNRDSIFFEDGNFSNLSDNESLFSVLDKPIVSAFCDDFFCDKTLIYFRGLVNYPSDTEIKGAPQKQVPKRVRLPEFDITGKRRKNPPTIGARERKLRITFVSDDFSFWQNVQGNLSKKFSKKEFIDRMIFLDANFMAKIMKESSVCFR